MAENTLKRLGIVYAEESNRGLTHPFFSLVLNAFKEEAEELGCEVTFINNRLVSTETGYTDYCRAGRLDAVCVVCADYSSESIRNLVYSGIPCVTIDHLFKRSPAVLSDNETGIEMLVEHAISKGHRRIAFVHGHNTSIVTRARIMQFRNVMSCHHLPIPDEYIQEGRYDDIRLTRKLVTGLLMLPERPTFILLPDDISYLGAQDAAKECAMRIPEDISFAGYDGIPLTQTLRPRLTTVRQDCDQLGKLAARRLVDLLGHPDTASRLPAILPVEFMEGGTVGNAPDV